MLNIWNRISSLYQLIKQHFFFFFTNKICKRFLLTLFPLFMLFFFLCALCLNNTKYSSKWKNCRIWWNRQHWNVNWLHHRFRYQHHQHHCITIRRARFGRTNSISNHFHSVHRSTGELKFDIWFSRFFYRKPKNRNDAERLHWPSR